MATTSRLGTRRSSFSNFVFGHGGDLNNDTFNESIVFSSTDGFNATSQRQRFESVTQNIVFTQSVIRVFTLTVVNTLSITSLAATQKIATRSISQNLLLIQTVNRTVKFNRTATNQIVFQTYFTKYFGNQSVNIPQARATKVESLVLLQTLTAVIVLPSAQLGDSQINSGVAIEVKHAITGTLRTYIKQSDLQKLRYTFILGRKKSLELRAFLLTESAKLITLTNWKGEIWVVNLVNSPFDLTAKSRWLNEIERVDITLEFEGVKIGG